MIALDAFLAGVPQDQQLGLLTQLREAIPARLRCLAAEHIRALVPRAVRATWTGDVSPNDDGTTTPCISTLAVVLDDGTAVSLPAESDLGSGLDWWDSIDFVGFDDADASEAFIERLRAATASAPGHPAAEELALAHISACLGVADVRRLIGTLTQLAEEEPFGESCELPPVSSSHRAVVDPQATLAMLLSGPGQPVPHERFDDDILSQAIDLLYLLAEERPDDPRFRRITWPMTQVAAKVIHRQMHLGRQG